MESSDDIPQLGVAGIRLGVAGIRLEVESQG